MANLSLVKHPWVTEKAVSLSALGKYVFRVDAAATKNEIKKAIHELYKVDVTEVNIINRRAKTRTFRNRKSAVGRISKAIVTLKKGQTIETQ